MKSAAGGGEAPIKHQYERLSINLFKEFYNESFVVFSTTSEWV